jgi:hypothetical protein
VTSELVREVCADFKIDMSADHSSHVPNGHKAVPGLTPAKEQPAGENKLLEIPKAEADHASDRILESIQPPAPARWLSFFRR